MTYKPKFISFDCYGTLINFEMGPTAKRIFEDRVPADRMPAFLDSFRYYRLDEVLGEWKPFFDVVENSIQRTCKAHGVEYRPSDALALYAAVPTWQPYPNVVETLQAIAPHVPLVILSNSMVDLIPHSVAHLKTPFHAVYTAEEARAYKPRAQMFEYMFDQLGCGPEQMMHVSSRKGVLHSCDQWLTKANGPRRLGRRLAPFRGPAVRPSGPAGRDRSNRIP